MCIRDRSVSAGKRVQSRAAWHTTSGLQWTSATGTAKHSRQLMDLRLEPIYSQRVEQGSPRHYRKSTWRRALWQLQRNVPRSIQQPYQSPGNSKGTKKRKRIWFKTYFRNNRHTLFLFGHSLSPLYHPFSIALQRKSDKQPGCRPALSLVYDYRYSIADICILQIYIQTGYGNQPLTRVCQTCR